ncbi:hypothetical protein [Lacrimispora celerecrescens]|jgi:hypothetical protein|uniref:Uncharacterized protein n=1 Tax=[Clostridium] celerecrescens 18A TaxID=1286362 RepID=A0A2M8Z9M8_9FIRM|nr:hypothetical protein [Lacrimispora celerecrescens]PJJ30143.1 hypothetical protein H171_3718 [[Clostridium] celerecrescens 18A]
METYKVAVCRFGHVMIMADSEEEAKQKVSKFSTEQVQWLQPVKREPPFLILYAESMADKSCR